MFPRGAPIRDNEVNVSAGPHHAVPLGERTDGIRHVLENMRSEDIVERVIVKRQRAGMTVVIRATRRGGESLEAVDVDRCGIDAGDGRGAGPDFGADLAGANPLRDFFLVCHWSAVAMASRL